VYRQAARAEKTRRRPSIQGPRRVGFDPALSLLVIALDTLTPTSSSYLPTHLLNINTPPAMQPNWQQQQQLQGGYYNPQQQQQPQQTGFGLQSQPTGFPGQQRPQPTGLPSGNLSFLNAPPPTFGGGGMGGGMTPQMTGFPGGGASGLMSQQTGFGGMGGMRPQPTGFGGGMMGQPTGMMSQPTGMLGQPTGLMSQPTGMGGGLRPQPTGYQDPRLQSMMQSFMPSNLSQVSCAGTV